MRAALAVAALALGAAACSAKPCGGCGPAQACDLASGSCQPALGYGQACLDADGGPLPLPCQQGSSCLAALTPAVCAQGCDPTATQSGCPSGDQCWAPLDDAGMAQLTSAGLPLGFCGGVSRPGQGCGVVGLSFCDPSLSCVLFTPGATDGVCFQSCDPTAAAGVCPATQQCLAVFTDPTEGLCWTSVAPGAPCEEAQLQFCPPGQLCLDPGDGGSCWVRCNPSSSDGGSAADCPVEGEECVAPTTNPGVGVCAQPVPSGGACDPLAGEFCDTSDFCIENPDGGSNCHQDCTTSQSCPPGQSCLPIAGVDAMACG